MVYFAHLLLPVRSAGETIDHDVFVHVVLDIRVCIGDAVDEFAEAKQAVARIGRRIHADDCNTSFGQHVEIALEQRVLDEHHFRLDEVDLPTMFLERITIVGPGCRSLALEGGPGVKQREIVVLQNAQVSIATPQLQTFTHHIHDAVREQMKVAVGVATLALGVDQRLAIAMVHRELFNGPGEVHLHGAHLKFGLTSP